MEGQEQYFVIEKTLYYCSEYYVDEEGKTRRWHSGEEYWRDPMWNCIFTSRPERLAKALGGKIIELKTKEDFKKFGIEDKYVESPGTEGGSETPRPERA